MSRAHWEWFGHAGHFIASNMCLFHMSTKVGRYLVSSVGDYYPRMTGKGLGGEAEQVGCDRYFETMVFETNGYSECGCPTIKSFANVDLDAANTPKECLDNHLKMCLKYDQLQEREP